MKDQLAEQTVLLVDKINSDSRIIPDMEWENNEPRFSYQSGKDADFDSISFFCIG